jgi:superfamily II DNA or RNA helicase
MSYQLAPALSVTHGIANRILIADEVGLGKTIQAALIVAEILERTCHGRALIVCPASLKEQWQTELHDRFGLDAWVADSDALVHLGEAFDTANPWLGRPVTITSIDFVKRAEVMRALEALVWDAVVLDEAHALTSHSARAIAARALARRARTVVLLTATPHSGDDQSFESLSGIGDLNRGFPLLTFRRTRQDVGLTVARRTTTLRVRPTLAEHEMHRTLEEYVAQVRSERGPATDPAHLAMTVLTRRACSSAASLARSIERRLDLIAGEGPPAMPQLMLPLFEAADDEPGVELAAPGLGNRHEECRWLDRLRFLARRARSAESKLLALARLLRRVNEPAIVFTEYRDTLAHLAQVLQWLAPVMLHGGLTASERRENLRCFTTGSVRLLLATDAASEGLNLQQRCRLVVNLELPWTPVRLEQRIGRVERIGQARRVHAVHLLAAGTAEESFAGRLLTRAGLVADGLERLRHQSTELDAMRAAAEVEVARLEKLRLLMPSRESGVATGRPPLTILRRRRSRHNILWGFCLAFVDSSDQLVWRTLIGANTTHSQPGVMLNSIDAAAELLTSRLDANQRKAYASLEGHLRGYLALATGRERAIAKTLESERARLSATLLQRGLFDRRADRALADQTAVLDEALARCRARLQDFTAAGQIVAEPARLAFVVVRR